MPTVGSRSEALRRLRASTRAVPLNDDGGILDDDSTETFCNLPKPPPGWDNPEAELDFNLSAKRAGFLRRKLSLLTRPGEAASSLLARLAEARNSYPGAAPGLPRELDAHADAADKQALGIARDAAALAALGRAVYGALVEQLRADDGGSHDNTFCMQLSSHFDEYGKAAARCDLAGLATFLPALPDYVQDLLQKTQAFVRNGKPEAYFSLRECYRRSEVMRKTSGRARLANTVRSAQRRAEWDPGTLNTKPAALPLEYRPRHVDVPNEMRKRRAGWSV